MGRLAGFTYRIPEGTMKAIVNQAEIGVDEFLNA